MSEQRFTILKPIYVDALVSHLQAHLKRALIQASSMMADAGLSLAEQAQCLRLQSQAIESFLRQFKARLQSPELGALTLQSAEQFLLQAVVQADERYSALLTDYPSALLLPGQDNEPAIHPALSAPVWLRLWLQAVESLPLGLRAQLVLVEAWLAQLPSAQNDISGLVEAWLRKAQLAVTEGEVQVQPQWLALLDQLHTPFPAVAQPAAMPPLELLALLPVAQQAQLQHLFELLAHDSEAADQGLQFTALYALTKLQQQPLSVLLPLNQQPAINTLLLVVEQRNAAHWLPLISFLTQTEAAVAAQLESLACAATFSEQLKQARAGVIELLQERLGGVAWPRLICDIVDEHWLPMLLEIDWRYGRASSEWLTALTVLDELLAMMEPNLSLAMRLDMSEQLPQLLVRLRSLLVADGSVDLVRRRQTRQVFSVLLDRLAEIHLALIQEQPWPDSQLWQPPQETVVPELPQAAWWRSSDAELSHCLYRDANHAIVLNLASGKLQLLPLNHLAAANWQAVA